MRIDSDASKMIIMAGKVFLGLSSKHADLSSLIEEPFLKENYHIADLDTSSYYPPKSSQKNYMELGNFEKDLQTNLRILRSDYLKKIMELSLNEKKDVRVELVKIQKDLCKKIQDIFFRFFEEEEQFTRIEKKYLNLKKVKYLRQHKFILKETNKLIEGFNKPHDFIKEMVYEHTFLNFAYELPSWGLTPSFRYKSLMAANECKKLKLPLVNPALSIRIEINDQELLNFYLKMGKLEGVNKEFLKDSLKILYSILNQQDKNQKSNFSPQEPTALTLHDFSLISFFKKFLSKTAFFEEKIDEKDEETFLKNLQIEITSINFEEVILEDYEKLERCVNGRIMNIIDDPTLEITKHLLLANKSLYMAHIADRKKVLSKDFNVQRKIFDVLFECFQQYTVFEEKYLSKTKEFKRALDFPDFPRGLFHKLLILLKENPNVIKEFISIIQNINQNSNVFFF